MAVTMSSHHAGVLIRACKTGDDMRYFGMAQGTYQIVHRDDGSFAVEIVRPGVLPQMAAGFATEAEASGWIAQDKRLWDASDPFQLPGRRKWRGF